MPIVLPDLDKGIENGLSKLRSKLLFAPASEVPSETMIRLIYQEGFIDACDILNKVYAEQANINEELLKKAGIV